MIEGKIPVINDLVSQVPLPPPESWLFVEELKTPVKRSFAFSGAGVKNPVSIASGVKVIREAEDPEGVLLTAYEDLDSFFRETGIPAGEYPVITRIRDCGPNDSFEIEVTPEMCIIYGSNLEGVRRGIFYFEDLLLGNGAPLLAEGVIRKKAWVRQRISRCFFGPIKRPPHNRDELMDEYDYYPDAYLNRLAHEGVNGLWLTVTFKDLCRTSFTAGSEYGKDAPQRLAKLRRTVDQCLRYGIKTYIFTIEPAAWPYDSPVIKKFPELAGAKINSGYCFCPSSETARRYLFESVNYIFSAVPKLGGMINISWGERATTCLSSLHAEVMRSQDTGSKIDCPRCGNLDHKEIIFNSVSAMTAGMRSAAPEAEFISWKYMSHPLELQDWAYTLSKMPEGATPLWNFESGGIVKQLGKDRIAGDYWLSYVGPSERFLRCARECPPGVKPGAKLQVGCSHEVATVPYVPVPGLLYRKYREMYKLGVDTVMQCWYFGNYPGIMNKAAGLLSFEDFSTDEHTFIAELLKPEWGRYTDTVAGVYQKCSEAYSNYPVSNTIQYFGPFHDGVVWPLYCNEQNLPLNPTWLTNFPVSGDTIGEALDNHTLDEVTELSRIMSSSWSEAVAELLKLQDEFASAPERLRDIALLRVMELHFITGYDIFKFYSERSRKCGVTPLMREILQRQIGVSREMAELCRRDSRIGFHSESENYRYFPEKLEARAIMLERELELPAPPCSTLIPAGDGRTPRKEVNFDWSLKYGKDDLTIDVVFHGSHDSDQIMAVLRENPESQHLFLDLNRNGAFYPNKFGASFEISDLDDGWRAVMKVPYHLFTSDPRSFRISFGRYQFDNGQATIHYTPESPTPARYRLRLGLYFPQYMYQITNDTGMDS